MGRRPATWVLSHWAVLLLTAACSSEPALIYPELPLRGLVAALYVDQNAHLVASSGLTASRSPLELEVDAPTTDARRVLLAGFDSETISTFTDLGPDALARSPLVIAEASDPELPAPVFWAEGELDRDPVQLETAPSDEAFPLRLTSSWLPPCDRSLESITSPLLRLSCGSIPCDPRVVQRGCTLAIDTHLCTPSIIEAPVGPAPGELGPPSVDGALSACTSRAPRAGALYSLDCGGTGAPCLLDVFAPGLPTNPTLATRSSPPLLEVTPLDELPSAEVVRGYLSGLAHSGGHLLVSSFDGVVDETRCAEPHRTRLFVLEDETLEIVATSTAPSCLTTVVGDPVGGGFIGIAGNPASRIVRIDLRGRIVAERPLPPEIRAPLVATSSLYDGGPLARGGPAHVIFTFAPAQRRARSYAVVFDPATLAVLHVLSSELGVSDRSQDYVSIMPGAKNEEYVVLDRQHEDLWSFEVDQPDAPDQFPLSLCGQSGTPVELARSQPLTALFRSFESGRGAIGFFGLRGDTLCSRIASFEIAADPTAMTGWRDSTVLHLVGLRRTEPEADRRAYLAFFDSELPGFRPGMLEVGYGDVGRLVSSVNGVVYATLPWTAQVLRIEAAP